MAQKASPLVEKLNKRLNGGRFRMINELLSKKVKLNKSTITKYFNYYSEQIKKWEINPLDTIISHIGQKKCKIADVGCGSGKLQAEYNKIHSKKTEKIKNGNLSKVKTGEVSKKTEKIKSYGVTSFDLYPVNSSVVKADMDHLPIDSEIFDTAVYSLSLMGNEIGLYIKEANRILKVGGELIIAELNSRIDGDFIKKIEDCGFKSLKVESFKYFSVFIFEKVKLAERNVKIEMKRFKYKKR